MSGFAKASAVVLILSIFSSALLVVYSKHRQRILFGEYQQLRIRGDAASAEWGRLLLEEATLGNLNRVESIAQKKLAMEPPSPNQLVRIDR